MPKPKRRAILEACTEISFPLLLILLCILAVFAPSFIMNGVPKAMFLPLSLSIAFAMIVSYFAAQTVVPIISNWLIRAEKYQYHHEKRHGHAGLALDQKEEDEVELHRKKDQDLPKENGFFQRIKIKLAARLQKWMPSRKLIAILYFILAFAGAGSCYFFIGKDLLP